MLVIRATLLRYRSHKLQAFGLSALTSMVNTGERQAVVISLFTLAKPKPSFLDTPLCEKLSLQKMATSLSVGSKSLLNLAIN